jgi:hypothetical protein
MVYCDGSVFQYLCTFLTVMFLISVKTYPQMATSDSEDFESADEDLGIQNDQTTLHSAKQTEPDVYLTDECSDNRKDKDAYEIIRNEAESGEVHHMSEEAPDDKKDIEASDINKKAIKIVESKIDMLHSDVPSGGGNNINSSGEAVTKYRTKDRQRKECVKRQQNVRDPKSSSSVRKLGTKISPSLLCRGSESESEKVKQDFFASEKSEKTGNQTVVGTNDKGEGKSLPVPSYKLENLKQEVGKLSVERSEHGIAPVLDKLSQSASEEVCESNL